MELKCMKSVSSDWVEVQTKVFLKWLNNCLEKDDLGDMKIESVEDLKNGVALIRFILMTNPLARIKINQKVNMPMFQLENIVNAMNYFSAEGIKTVNISANDIHDGNLKLVLGFLWTLIQHYQDLSKNDILDWVKTKISTVSNFTTDWTDGEALWTLVDSLCPYLGEKEGLDTEELLDKAFTTAEKYLNIPKLFQPRDLMDAPDEKSVMTYINYFKEFSELLDYFERSGDIHGVIMNRVSTTDYVLQLLKNCKKDPVLNLQLELFNLNANMSSVDNEFGATVTLLKFRKNISLISPDSEYEQVFSEILDDLPNMINSPNFIFELIIRVDQLHKLIGKNLAFEGSPTDICRAASIAVKERIHEINLESIDPEEVHIFADVLNIVIEEIEDSVTRMDLKSKRAGSIIVQNIKAEARKLESNPIASLPKIEQHIASLLEIVYHEDVIYSNKAKEITKQALTDSFGNLLQQDDSTKKQVIQKSVGRMKTLTGSLKISQRKKFHDKIVAIDTDIINESALANIQNLMEDIGNETQYVSKKESTFLVIDLISQQLRLHSGDETNLVKNLTEMVHTYCNVISKVVDISDSYFDVISSKISKGEKTNENFGKILEIVQQNTQGSSLTSPSEYAKYVNKMFLEILDMKPNKDLTLQIVENSKNSTEYIKNALSDCQEHFSALSEQLIFGIDNINDKVNPSDSFEELLLIYNDIYLMIKTDFRDEEQNTFNSVVQEYSGLIESNPESKSGIEMYAILKSGLEDTTLMNEKEKKSLLIRLEFIDNLRQFKSVKENLTKLFDIVNNSIHRGVNIRMFVYTLTKIISAVLSGLKSGQEKGLIIRKSCAQLKQLFYELKVLWTDVDDPEGIFEDFIDELIELFTELPTDYLKYKQGVRTKIYSFLESNGIHPDDNIEISDLNRISLKEQLKIVRSLWSVLDRLLLQLENDSNIPSRIPKILGKNLDLFFLSAISHPFCYQADIMEITYQIALFSKSFTEGDIETLTQYLDDAVIINDNIGSDEIDFANTYIDTSVLFLDKLANGVATDIAERLSYTMISLFDKLNGSLPSCTLNKEQISKKIIHVQKKCKKLATKPNNNSRKIMQDFFDIQDLFTEENGLTPSTLSDTLLFAIKYLIKFESEFDKVELLNEVLLKYIDTWRLLNEEYEFTDMNTIVRISESAQSKDWSTALSLVGEPTNNSGVSKISVVEVSKPPSQQSILEALENGHQFRLLHIASDAQLNTRTKNAKSDDLHPSDYLPLSEGNPAGTIWIKEGTKIKRASNGQMLNCRGQGSVDASNKGAAGTNWTIEPNNDGTFSLSNRKKWLGIKTNAPYMQTTNDDTSKFTIILH